MSSRGEMPLVLGNVVFCSHRCCAVGRCESRLGFCTGSSPPFFAEEASKVAQMVKNPPADAGDTGSIPGSGRSPGGGRDDPLRYSCLENPMDRKAWWATDHRVARVGHFSSVQFSHSIVSDSLRPHEPQHIRPPCPSPTPRVHPNPCPLSP